MGDLTPNISRHEISCNCGCGFDSIDYLTTLYVQQACDHFSAKLGHKCILNIHSGCRCPIWNKHEGGAERSQHLFARAIDHDIEEITPLELAQYYLDRFPGVFGIGIYKTFVHFDTRTGLQWRKS